ncbi:Crp/Fnr family transcriptional regulator [Streptomyces sp. D2-8]|uniref:Crp/Fnr family transcriptional regulator n=1 Tax=Streptomyces sp. D2-8 TaxID=2707767 RepID=UPI0020BF8EB0|nr:Crp/Fnr family transcriptional regulator [Streptomyces sp. D2-8]
MTTASHISSKTAAIPVHAVWGAAAGLVGGVGMGIWMSASRPVMDTAMITMVAGLLGSTNAFAGWLIHLAIALFAGTTFGIVLGHLAQRPTPAIGLGLAYGVAWWTSARCGSCPPTRGCRHDNYAEALDDTVVCVMSRADVHRLLLADPCIAARITAILGRRLADLEQRLSDTVFKTVAQRIATALTTLTSAQAPAGLLRSVGRHPQIALTHEQLAALAGTSRETCTKVLREYAEHGLLRLARGRITVLDAERLKDASG